MESRVFGLAFVGDGRIDALEAFLFAAGIRPVEPAAS
ncbi:hypothetical protein FHR83_003215 [Actinoplanes campanulatus]|uniref:Uncharacterized protein n=1 Tax=Actinoplanes campanulatus TaxID=113559 RepID=A0A7W5FEN5_9ACTN|nr:hypothetical protein [Actinoplanes campanulatus]